MELRFEEYCDADLSLIRDYYETTFSHYVPDLAERIFVVRDAHWLVGAVRLRDEQDYYHLCGFRLLPHYQSLGLGSRLLQHACNDLLDKPVICHALPFEKPFYLKAGFATFPCMNSTDRCIPSITSSANRVTRSSCWCVRRWSLPTTDPSLGLGQQADLAR